ncbi:hypothetical protein TELCIR_04032 [Teladorsagia circumcincta]|uniref:Tetratricopeptide repeat protein 7 N-terminal domain-containing protein n=1 Tax=Teladorsagia circumcincta TaxID=45464 RepID=A0A2G9UUN2_TELCI|nr:hypothetical protein TELCIR_04032 [Teladorsagia circumcincta]
MKSKHSGMEDMVELVEAELQLETFLEQQGVYNQHKAVVFSERALRCASDVERNALKDIENSGMELANTPFRTLRALRLVAEVYAIKGFCLEAMQAQEKDGNKMKALFCYEKAAELAIMYVGEIEKNIVGGSGKGSAATSSPLSRSEKLGFCLEAMQAQEKDGNKMKALFCYEKAAELAIMYVGEIEKNIVGGSGKGWLYTPIE